MAPRSCPADRGPAVARAGGALCFGQGRAGGADAQALAGSTVAAADTWARQHSATRFGFKLIQTESKIFQMDSKFSKL
jgi:uncharacterized membrane protein